MFCRFDVRKITVTVLCFTVFGLIQITPATAAASTVYTEPTTGMQLVQIAGGTFTMGDNNDRHASPAHEVQVPTFYIGKYEVTFTEYDIFCNQTGRALPEDEGWGRGSRPVINVSWHDAVAFANWLSQKAGKTFRLPTEAEWEYAARGGSTSAYPWGDTIGKNTANCKNCDNHLVDAMTTPVGTFGPNGYGLYDTSGNVYEWMSDHLHMTYEGAPNDGSAWTTGGTSSDRMTRSGSWHQPAKELTNTRRCWERANAKGKEYGFRLVREP